MWIRLFYAEWQKIIGNRWVTIGMIWIFPFTALVLMIFALIGATFSESFREGMQVDPAQWTEMAMFPWFIPNNPLGRGLLLGFTAVIFAGEYQWNTWKMIVPRSRRIPLILIKFLAVAVFVIYAFMLMSILMALGFRLISWVAGSPYGPEISFPVISEFCRDYALQMLYAFTSTVIASGFAAIAAMVTRSILGSAIAAIIIGIAETALILPLFLLSWLLDSDLPMHLYRFIPAYNLLNLFSWLVGETPGGLTFPSGEVIVDSLPFAMTVVSCWIVGLIALTTYLFQKQDITN